MRKLLFNKSRLLLLSILFVLYALIGFMASYGGEFEIEDRAQEKEAVTQFMALIEENKGKLNLKKLFESTAAVDAAIKQFGKGEPFNYSVNRDPVLRFNNMYVSFGTQVNNYLTNLDNINGKMNELKADGKTESYEYRALEKKLKAELLHGEPTFEYARTWNFFLLAFEGQLVFFLFMMVLTFFISPLFTQEIKTEMDSIVLCSQKGRREIVTAKLLSAAAVSVILAIIYVGGWFLGIAIACRNFSGFYAPVRSMAAFGITLVNTTGGGAAILCFVWLLIVAATFGLALAFVSSIMKNQSSAFGIGIVILIVGMASGWLNKIRDLAWPLMDFNFSIMSSSTTIWGSDKLYDFLGMPISYGMAASIACILILGVFSLLTYLSQKKRSVV